MIGVSKQSKSKHAWAEVYRSLQHGTAKSACEHKAVVDKFPPAIIDFALTFADMQIKRHKADYSPVDVFYKSAVKVDIERAEGVIAGFLSSPTKDRRAFASWLLFKAITNKK